MDQWIRKTYINTRNAINCIRLLGFDGFRILLQTLFGSHSAVTVSIAGQTMEVRLNTTDLATLLQIFWNHEYEFTLGQTPQVIIDGGANVGYSTLYFAKRYPDARIICVELHPENFAQLQKNTAQYSQVSAIQAAVWHTDENLGLWDPDEGHWGFRVDTTGAADPSSQITIKGITISAIIEQFDLSQIDLLKLDIEGSEKEVFENSEAWIDSVGVIVAEVHDKYRVGCSRAFYNATQDFPDEVRLGENILMLRAQYRP